MSHYKPHPKYKDSGVEWIGPVPEHWGVAPLKVLAQVVNGATPDSGAPAYWDGDIAWFTPADLDNEIATELVEPRRRITADGLANCAARLTPAGSVVLSTRAPVGSVGVTRMPSATNQGCRSLVPVPSVQPKFLAETLVAARSELALRSNGTTFQELSTDSLSSLRFPLPPPVIADADLHRLDDFLNSDAVTESAMDVATLEGFLTALVIGPRVVMPSAWLRWVWDFENGEDDVVYEGIAQAQEVMGLVMGLMNRIAQTFQRDPESFEPVFFRGAQWGAAEWCEGFLKATQLFDAEDWAALWAVDAFKGLGDVERISLATPLLRLGDETGLEITKQEGDAQRWVDTIVPALAGIHAHWAERRSEQPATPLRAPMRREAPKVGRNDPCPCGSGHKYKKCCGQQPTLH